MYKSVIDTESDDSVSCQERKDRSPLDTDNNRASSAVIDMYQDMNEKLKSKIKINNIICIVIASIYNVLNIFFIIQPCMSDRPYKFSDYSRSLTTIMFTLLGVSFFCVGVTMNLSLRKYFPDFYNNFACVLWMACLFLTLPLLFRAIINGA